MLFGYAISLDGALCRHPADSRRELGENSFTVNRVGLVA